MSEITLGLWLAEPTVAPRVAAGWSADTSTPSGRLGARTRRAPNSQSLAALVGLSLAVVGFSGSLAAASRDHALPDRSLVAHPHVLRNVPASNVPASNVPADLTGPVRTCPCPAPKGPGHVT